MNTYKLDLAVTLSVMGSVEVQANSIEEAIEQARSQAEVLQFGPDAPSNMWDWNTVNNPDWAHQKRHRIIAATCAETNEHCLDVPLWSVWKDGEFEIAPAADVANLVAISSEPHLPIPAAHLTSLDELTALAEGFCKSNNLEHQDVSEMLANPSRYTNDQLAWLSAFSDVWSEVESAVAGGNI